MLIIVFFIAVVMELIDSSLGMMYGTLSSPILILLGYDPKWVVPSIVISQALGGAIAAFMHHKNKNANFKGLTRDTKIVLAVVIPGIAAVVLGVWTAVKVPTGWLNLYIAILVIVMGILCIRPVYYTFNWWKMWLIGILSGFNKAASGGGYGPVTSTGKILGGLEARISIATTTYAEVPICIASFIVWWIMGGAIHWSLPLTLCTGSLIGGFFGPYITKLLSPQGETHVWRDRLRMGVGALAILAGILLIVFKLKI